MKIDRVGQSKVLTNKEIALIRENLPSAKYKLIFDIAIFTGERWGAIVQLKFFDVYDHAGAIRSEITFKKQTRKRSAGKDAQTRQVPIHPKLKESLLNFEPEQNAYLFSSKTGDCPITLRSADLALRQALDKCGLDNKGISTHSTRRTFITRLVQSGIPISTVQHLVGHKDISITQRYIHTDTDEQTKAINALDF